MKKIAKVFWMALILGCSSSVFAGPNEQIGTVVGGIAGGILGNNIGHGSGRTAATIGGAVIGSLVGNQVGSSADANDRYIRRHYQYSRWDGYRPCPTYPPRYRHTFIGRDGRLCRRSVLTNDYGDTVYATYCCYHMSRDGFCSRWVRVY